MAWEQRARGNRYYVRKRWVSGRCVSEYIGVGEDAVLLAGLDAAARRGQRQGRAVRRREDEIDAALDEVTEIMAILLTATLLVAGCHTHRGQWRRRREHA